MSKSIQQRSNVAVYVVLKGARRVALVQALYPKDGAGRLSVEVHTWDKTGNYTEYKSSASGYGYCKQTAALAGAVIDGYVMADHCGRVEDKAMKAAARLLKQHQAGVLKCDWQAKAKRLGFRFANWDDKRECYTSLHPQAGLDRLTDMGYRVLQAI
jgi:hypothetical protein